MLIIQTRICTDSDDCKSDFWIEAISENPREASQDGRSALKCGVVKLAVMPAKPFIQQPGIHQRNPQ